MLNSLANKNRSVWNQLGCWLMNDIQFLKKSYFFKKLKFDPLSVKLKKRTKTTFKRGAPQEQKMLNSLANTNRSVWNQLGCWLMNDIQFLKKSYFFKKLKFDPLSVKF